MFHERRAYLGFVEDFSLTLPDEAATAQLARALSRVLAPGDCICLSGPLGAGKTTLARTVIKELSGVLEAPSPTYGLVETYDAAASDGSYLLWHFDLYRLEKPEEVYELGFDEALADGACLIEWPERIASLIPSSALLIRIEPEEPGRRVIIRGGDHWRNRLKALKDSQLS